MLTTRYWVIKGNPIDNDWDRMLKPGAVDTWHAVRVPRDWSPGDRLFCWESAPDLRVVGLAVLTDTDSGIDEYGDRLFRVRYLTARLSSMPTITELRTRPILNTASFLKRGQRQLSFLFRMTKRTSFSTS